MQIDIARRRRWCYLKHKEGWSVRIIAKQLDVPKTTVHRWISWSIEGRPLSNLSKKPRNHFRKKIRKSVEDEICSLRKRHLWGPDKIKGYLSKKGIEASQWTVYSILVRKGLNHALAKPRRKLRYIRWERDSPNDLWQCDWKYVREQNKWLVAYIDDHSRFVTTARLCDNATSENAIDCLIDGIKRFGAPREILTDHGTQFYSVRRGESAFDKKLKEFHVIHILSGIGRPTTTGKIERFFATYSLEGYRYNTLEYFLHYYNHIRPHQSLEYETPAERYMQQTVPDVVT